MKRAGVFFLHIMRFHGGSRVPRPGGGRKFYTVLIFYILFTSACLFCVIIAKESLASRDTVSHPIEPVHPLAVTAGMTHGIGGMPCSECHVGAFAPNPKPGTPSPAPRAGMPPQANRTRYYVYSEPVHHLTVSAKTRPSRGLLRFPQSRLRCDRSNHRKHPINI